MIFELFMIGLIHLRASFLRFFSDHQLERKVLEVMSFAKKKTKNVLFY